MRKAAQFFLLMMTFVVSGVASGEIPWQTNLRQAHTQAQASGKLLLLHFYTDDCVWCDRLEEGSFRAPQVKEAIGQNFVPVKVHAAKSPKLTEMFRVKSFPTDVIVTIDGRTLAHTVSPQDPKRYVAMLQKTVPALGPSSSNTQIAAAQRPATQSPAVTGPSATTMQSPVAGPTASPQPATTASMTMPSVDKTQATLAANRQAPGGFGMPPMGAPEVTQPTSDSAAAVSAPPATSMDLPGAPGGLVTPAPENAVAGVSSNDVAPVTGTPDASTLNAGTAAAPASSVPEVTTNGTIEQPELAMQGYCAVTVIDQNKWVEGSPEFGVIHLGKLYLFTSEENMNQFLADPVPYTPVLNEIDVVRFFEERKIVPGKREWGLKDPIYNRMFFFADEEAMNHFYNEYERYTDAAIEVMEKAVKDANPGE